jgi:hypothetical protein
MRPIETPTRAFKGSDLVTWGLRVAIMAAMRMKSVCREKEAMRIQRLQGEKWRWKLLKQKLPKQKLTIEMRARSQRSFSSGAMMPRPR